MFEFFRLSNKKFLQIGLIVTYVAGVLGISLKLTLLTNVYNVYFYPVCYLDWLFLSVGAIILGYVIIKRLLE